MKIGIDARLWNETGVGRYIRALVTHLMELDTKNEYVVFLRAREFHKIHFSRSNWQTQIADVSWHSLAEQLEMPGIYKSHNLDLLHIPYFAVPFFTPQPYVVTIHDLTISRFATGLATTRPLPIYGLKRLGYNLVLTRALKRAHTIITVSQTVKQELLTEYQLPPDKVKVIYEAGELETTAAETKIKAPEPYLLYVGNAHPHKNLERLLAAFPLLKVEFPKLHLVLIGKRDYFYQRLEKQVAPDASDIIFAGDVTNAELIYWYKHALALVFPTLAAYFDPYDTGQLVKTLTQILKNKTWRQKLISQGHVQSKLYSWKKMAAATLNIYEDSLSLRSRK